MVQLTYYPLAGPQQPPVRRGAPLPGWSTLRGTATLQHVPDPTEVAA